MDSSRINDLVILRIYTEVFHSLDSQLKMSNSIIELIYLLNQLLTLSMDFKIDLVTTISNYCNSRSYTILKIA